MPTIVFVSTKGGVGKTTASLLLASLLSRGASVALIDADPNHPLKNWSKGAEVPAGLTIISDVDEDNILEKIEVAAAANAFVIVDLEGTAAKIVVMAVSQADFVIIPTQGSQLDAEQAGRAFRLIQQQEKMARRNTPNYKLPYSVLLTRTNPAIRTRTMSHIARGLVSAGVPVFETELNEREAFKAMFSFRQPLERLDSIQVANLDKAINNAEAFANEVISALRNGRSVQLEEVI